MRDPTIYSHDVSIVPKNLWLSMLCLNRLFTIRKAQSCPCPRAANLQVDRRMAQGRETPDQ